jgi:Ni/Co efflux regulator RcnB
MKNLIKTLTWSAVFAAAVSFGAAAYAQQPSGNSGKQDQSADRNQDRSRETEPASVNGELTRVMPDQKAFTVKSTSGAEMLFRYNDQTVIAGAESNAAGLATSSGSEVTVSYKNDSAGNMATRIEIHPKR